jgi:hypothetical protein
MNILKWEPIKKLKMKQIIMCSMRGTKAAYSAYVFKNWITENKQMKSFVSKSEGQKISSCKGTNTLWIKKQPKKNPNLTTKRVMAVNRGTRRIVIEN